MGLLIDGILFFVAFFLRLYDLIPRILAEGQNDVFSSILIVDTIFTCVLALTILVSIIQKYSPKYLQNLKIYGLRQTILIISIFGSLLGLLGMVTMYATLLGQPEESQLNIVYDSIVVVSFISSLFLSVKYILFIKSLRTKATQK